MKSLLRISLPCLLLAVTIVAQPAPPASNPAPVTGWTIEETLKVRLVGHVRIAPGGKRVLYTVRTAILEGDKGSYCTRIFTANADGAHERALTGADYSASCPEWSPDGRWIAFAADRSGRGQGHTLWIIPADGGKPQPIEVGGTEVTTLKWSPDGSRIAFTMPTPPTPVQAQASAHPDAPKVVDADKREVRLWVIRVARDGSADGGATALSPESLSVRTDVDFGAPFDWAPDGNTIAFSTGRDWWGKWSETGISVVDTRSGKTRSLVPAGAMAPAFSPDGRAIAYLGSAGPYAAHNLDVHTIELASGRARKLAQTFDHHPTLVGWSANGRRIYVLEARKTVTRIIALPVDGGPAADVDPGDAVLGSVAVDPSRTLLGFTRQTLREPMEACLSPVASFAPAKVSRVNAALPPHPLPRTEVTRWQSADGTEIEGLLTYPIAHDPNRRYPTVIAVRSGGVAFRQTFVANPFQDELVDYYPVTELAARGFAVLQCNSRGGTLPGYGPAAALPFTKPKEKGQPDVLAGVDHLVRIGVADGDRLGLTGLSNGGLVTAWIITQTRRFKAAIIDAGLPDLAGLTGQHAWISHDLAAEPWENLQPYREHAPLLHIGGVATPTLILHGDRDQVVPLSQGYSWYRTLQRRGVPTEMVVYPGEGHPVTAPKHLIDIGRRHVEWMTKHLR